MLEVAVGTGLNLPFYPDEITLTGLDLSQRMLDIARDVQRLVELITVPLASEHFLRRPLHQIQALGLEVEQRQRFKLGLVERLVAGKPSD